MKWVQLRGKSWSEISGEKSPTAIVGDRANRVCKWHLEEKDGYNLEEHDYWETTCNNLFQFDAGGPKQNHFEFCPYCGKPIEEVEQ